MDFIEKLVLSIFRYLMFRFKTGPFKEETPLTKVDPNLLKRTLFMSQLSRSEFDLMVLGTEQLLTVYEFDKKRSSLKSQETIEEII